MFSNLPLLSLVIWTPIIGGLLVLITGSERKGIDARAVALLVALLTFVLSVPLFTHFDTSLYTMQFGENIPWIKAFNINYHLGVDGISMPLIVLTSFMTVIVVIAGCRVITYKTTFDHRILDGATADYFLARVVESLEKWN